MDTNVPATANNDGTAAPLSCVASSAKMLQALMLNGHLFVDDGGLIVAEYRRNLRASGQPGPGDAFLKWVLLHEWSGVRITRVHITSRPEDPEDFNELPGPPDGIRYDRADRKFLAVAAAHKDRPPILQSLDHKWWGWRAALATHGVQIHFVCPMEIEAKYLEKAGG